MPDGSRFNEPQWNQWTEAMKIAVWSLVADPPPDRRVGRIASVCGFYTRMRILVQWMHDNGYQRLNQLTRTGQRSFIDTLKHRKGKGQANARLTEGSLYLYQQMLQVLFLQGRRYPQIAIAEPAPQDAVRLEGTRVNPRAIPRTPEPVAVALVAGAIRLLGAPAEDIIEARDRLLALYDEIGNLPGGNQAIWAELRKRLDAAPLTWKRSRRELWYSVPPNTIPEVRTLIDRLSDAASVILSYLVGMRISEILGLEAGCITRRPRTDGGEAYTLVTGKIYKTAPTAAGEPHTWVAPPIAERAVKVLERISRPLRERTGKPNLWLVYRGGGVKARNASIGIPSTTTMTGRLNMYFAPFIGLSQHEGKPWHLTTHQGRKTFAYFVAKQDRSGLEALRDQLGHRSVVMTDQGYSPRDAEMAELISKEGTLEMAEALAELLTAPDLAGDKGKEIVRRSRYRGQFTKDEAVEYAKQLLRDTAMHIEICFYGICVYDPRHAACQGDAYGPNHALRTQSVCVRCKNFAAGPKHLPVWKERRHSYEVVLAETPMSPAATSAVREKITECNDVIGQIENQPTAA